MFVAVVVFCTMRVRRRREDNLPLQTATACELFFILSLFDDNVDDGLCLGLDESGSCLSTMYCSVVSGCGQVPENLFVRECHVTSVLSGTTSHNL